MVRAFYRESTNTLIVTPYRCGSTHLIENSGKYGLLFLTITPERKRDIEIFQDVQKTCEEKIFIWRNPFERLISFYYNFIFLNHKNSQDHRKLFANPTSSKNFWKDLNNSFDKLEKNLSKDEHTISQSLYFELFDPNIETYTVLDIQDYAKWIMLTFANKVETRKSVFDIISTSVTMSDIILMIDAKNKAESLYRDDYLLQKYITRI